MNSPIKAAIVDEMENTHDPNVLMRRAEEAYRTRRYADARQDLLKLEKIAPGHAAIDHLRALVEKGLGNFDGALAAFIQAATAAPHNPSIFCDMANLFGQLGQYRDALTAFNRALEIAPEFGPALLGQAQTLHSLGQVEAARSVFDSIEPVQRDSAKYWNARAAFERSCGRLGEALVAYETAFAIAPANIVAQHGRARTALESGAAEAVEYYESARNAQPDNVEIALGLAEAREAAGLADAESPLLQALALRPDWVEGHVTLARMRREAADADFDREIAAAARAQPANRTLWLAYAELLHGSERPDLAAEIAAEALTHHADDAEFLLAQAVYYGEAENDGEARRLLGKVRKGFPGLELASARQYIRDGQPDAAEVLLSQVRAGGSADVMCWSLTGIAWRMLNDSRHYWLHEQPGLVSFRHLDLDEAACADIAEQLRKLHKTRSHPIGQSLRGGTQTRGNIFDRREKFIAVLNRAIGDALVRHWAELPALDTEHPLLRYRDKRPRIVGSWSVRLTDGGIHVAHIHPQGVVSSAAYLALPDDDMDGSDAPGCLEIGRPPPNLQTGLPPFKTIRPQVGHLALFPSTLHHGTRRFKKGERITVAFDITAA